MNKYLWAILLFSSQTFAQMTTKDKVKNFLEENIESISIRQVTPSMDTVYELGAKDVGFRTNATSGMNYAISTRYLDFSFTTKGSSSEEDVKNSEYSDIFFKTQNGDFELTFHQAEYIGANINEGPLTKDDLFFEDYQVNKQNFRTTYYLNTHFNKVLNNPRQAIIRRTKTKKNYFSSWLATIGYDVSKTNFPEITESLSKKVFDIDYTEFAQSDYIQNLDTKTTYYSLGYAGIHMLTQNFTYNFKISFGNGMQEAKYRLKGRELSETGTSRYIEYDIGLNYLINQTHNIGVLMETYQHSTDIGDTTINSNAGQISLFYLYLI